MAARLNCFNCGKRQNFRDRETPTIYCVRCRGRMNVKDEEAELEAVLESVTFTPKDGAKVEHLIALALDKGATENESAVAAKAVCQILKEKGAAAILKRPIRRGRGGR
jgi:DNA-directed RNA polymerase subunit RPC12/RpoP